MANWIWYPGDYEIRHGLKLNLRREELGYSYPAMWRLDDCWHNVKFHRTLTLSEPTELTLYARGDGYYKLDTKSCRFGVTYHVEPGEHTIMASVGRLNGLPCLFVADGPFATGKGWLASDSADDWTAVGYSDVYTKLDDDPEEFGFEYQPITPVSTSDDGSGLLYDFGRQTFARVTISGVEEARDVPVFYGESKTEARDLEEAYIRDCVEAGLTAKAMPVRAFRYIYLPDTHSAEISAEYEYLPLEDKGSFNSSDELLNKVWDIAAYTFHLNSREFFLDGIKRDRWVWSGDAYQSYFVSRALFMEPDIVRRTTWALRGKDPIEQHINTILDYSLYWIMAVGDYYDTFGDIEFLKAIWPRMRSLMDYCCTSVNEEGFIIGQPRDWVFVDWAELDKDGPIAPEQMLYIKALEATARVAELTGNEAGDYAEKARLVRSKLDHFFYDEEKGCYINSYTSGRRDVTRHANIFALLYGIADADKQASIIKNVLHSDAIPPITTPYFKFFELWGACEAGDKQHAIDVVRDYWGGMVKLGATTMWEEFDPRQDFPRHYAMYGLKYGKSLCHAWGAGPIYLIATYVMGLKPTAPGFKTFTVEPDPLDIERFNGRLPLPDGEVSIKYADGKISVTASRAGGTLIWRGAEYELPTGVTVTV